MMTNRKNLTLDDVRAEADATSRYKKRIARRPPNSTVEIFVSGFRYGVEYGRTGKVADDVPAAPSEKPLEAEDEDEDESVPSGPDAA